MPTVRYEIRNEYGLADPELYNSTDRDDPEAILEGVAMAGLVGLLRQLGDLAEFSAEVFHDLHEEVMVTASRSNALKLRVQQLEAELPFVEKTLLTQIGHPAFSYKSGTYWHANLQIDHNLVTQGDMPRFILDCYEECHAPPKLFMLDKFDVAGAGACLKRYSDPSFFKNTLDASGAVEDMDRETKILKNKKKGLRWKNSETLESLLLPYADHSSQPDITDQVPEKLPTKRVKLKPRHLAVHDISSNHMENLFNDQPPEEKLMLENSDHGSISSTIEIPDIRETLDPLFRKMTPTQSPEENEEAVLATAELEKQKVHGAELLDTQDESKVEEQKPYFSHPVVHLEDKPDDLETTGVNIVDELISDDIEGHLSYHKQMDRVEMVIDDGEGSDDLSHSDVVSEMESYMDALNTMESEVETDNESRARLGLGFAGAEYQAKKSEPDENQVLQVRFKAADNIGDYTASSVTVRKDIDTSDSEASGKCGGSMTTEESFAVAPNMLPNPDASSQETIDSVKTIDSGTGDLNQGKCTEQKPLEVYYAEVVDGSACQGLQDNGADMELSSADRRSYDGISDHQVSQYFIREQQANIFSESYMQETTTSTKAVDDSEVSLRCLNGNFEVSWDRDVNQLQNTDIPALGSVIVMDNYRLADATQLGDANAEEMTSIEARYLNDTYEVALDQDAKQLHADISGLPSLIEMESYRIEEATQGAHSNAEETTLIDAKVIMEGLVQIQNSNETDVAKQHLEELLSSSYPEREQVNISVSSAENRALIDTETNNDLSSWPPGSLIGEMENGIDIGGLASSRSILGFKDTSDISEDETSSFHWEPNLDAELQESGTEDLADSIEEKSLLSHCIDQQVPVIDNMVSAFGDKVSGPYDEGTERQSLLLVNENMVAGSNTYERKAHSLHPAVQESCPTTSSQPCLISHKLDVNNFDVDMKTVSSISVTDDGPGAHVHSNSILQNEDLEQHNTEDAESYCQEGRLELEKRHLVDTVNIPEGSRVIFVSKTASFGTSFKDSDNEPLGKPLNSLAAGPPHEDSNTHKARENEIEELHSEQNIPTRDALDGASNGNQVCVLSSLTDFCSEGNDVSNVDALDPQTGCQLNSHLLKEDAKVGAHLESMKPALDLAQEDVSMTSIKSFTEPVVSVEESSESQTDRLIAERIMNKHSDEYNHAAIELDSLQSDTKDDDKLVSTKDVHSGVDIISSLTSHLKDHVHLGDEASETQAVEMGLHSLHEDMHDEHLGGSDHHFETAIPTGDAVAVPNMDLRFDASEPEAQSLLSTEEVEEHQYSQLDLQVLATSDISSPELDLARLETSSQASEPQSVLPLLCSQRLDETPPLPPLPPLEWRIGKLCLGSLSMYDTLQTLAQSNKVLVPSFLENDHSHGLLTVENENGKSAKLPMPHLEGDLLQDASRVKVVQPLRLTELPSIVTDKGCPGNVILPEAATSNPPPGTVSVGVDMDMCTHSALEQNKHLASSLAQEENGHQLPLHGEDKQSMSTLDLPQMTMIETNTSPLTQVHQLLESMESDQSGLSGLNSESDYPQHLNPYLSVSSAEHSQSEHYDGVDEMQLFNQLAPLPVTESFVLPSGSTPFLGHNLFTSYGVIDPVMEDDKPYRRRSSILNRPRNPLIQAVASHDKSTLRKVSGMVKSKPKEGERDTLLEQIRNKSFNLKPAGVARPSIKGPQTNLKVAAILEKANAIRQACVGSDDDDEDGDWSDS